ncbi:hypothetical protein Acr_14g0006590 [Actinidia rufa]|uniref:Uncharacterized protein n=1 Tax=Actinidia rufa TaxID=165716 RepID=A0A7J0FR22_9ERIC|nr:hypothetical protein Acr_14g0006590 [Actinidia rufa]
MEGKSKIDTYSGPLTDMRCWHLARARRRTSYSTTTLRSAAGAVFGKRLFDGQLTQSCLYSTVGSSSSRRRPPCLGMRAISGNHAVQVSFCPLGSPSPIVPDPSSGAVIASILLYSDSLIMTVVQARNGFYSDNIFTELRHRDPPSFLNSDSSRGDSYPSMVMS